MDAAATTSDPARAADPRFDNPLAAQLRLPGFDEVALRVLGGRVRDLFAAGSVAPDRVHQLVDDAYVAELARAVTGSLGGKVGVAPRVFLKKLVAEVLDRVEQFEDFDPRRDYALTLRRDELSLLEREAMAQRVTSADDVELEL